MRNTRRGVGPPSRQHAKWPRDNGPPNSTAHSDWREPFQWTTPWLSTSRVVILCYFPTSRIFLGPSISLNFLIFVSVVVSWPYCYSYFHCVGNVHRNRRKKKIWMLIQLHRCLLKSNLSLILKTLNSEILSLVIFLTSFLLGLLTGAPALSVCNITALWSATNGSSTDPKYLYEERFVMLVSRHALPLVLSLLHMVSP